MAYAKGEGCPLGQGEGVPHLLAKCCNRNLNDDFNKLKFFLIRTFVNDSFPVRYYNVSTSVAQTNAVCLSAFMVRAS